MRIILLCTILTVSLICSYAQDIDSAELIRMAKEINISCPMSRGPNMRMDSARAKMADTLLLFLTITVEKDAQQVIQSLRKSESFVLQGLIKDRHWKYLMSQHVVLEYEYYYRKEKVIRWVFGPEQYKKYVN